MIDKRIDNYEKARRDRKAAQRWNDLPKGQKYQNSKFKISLPHSKPPKLCRIGQREHGGQNYWDTEEAFGEAMLAYLVENWDKVCDGVINIMIENEKEALRHCQSYIDEMQKQIDALDVSSDFGVE